METIYFESSNPNILTETNEIHNSPWDGSNISDPLVYGKCCALCMWNTTCSIFV